MHWPSALQKKATHSQLEQHGKDVRGVTLYTHMFVLADRSGRADEREHPHYTATAATPQEAEAAAYAVYQKAVACPHTFQRKSPTLLECPICGVQKRTPMTSSAQTPQKPKPQRRLFGLIRLT